MHSRLRFSMGIGKTGTQQTKISSHISRITNFSWQVPRSKANEQTPTQPLFYYKKPNVLKLISITVLLFSPSLHTCGSHINTNKTMLTTHYISSFLLIRGHLATIMQNNDWYNKQKQQVLGKKQSRQKTDQGWYIYWILMKLLLGTLNIDLCSKSFKLKNSKPWNDNDSSP
jgi:hypothetical protein